MHMRLQNNRLYGKSTSFWSIFIFMNLLITGCQHASVEPTQRNIEQMLNSGLQEHVVRVNETIVINTSPESAKWKISLGKRDFKQAEMMHFENNIQASFKLIKAGTYQVNMGSYRQNGQGSTMMHSIVIIVQ